MSCWWQVLSSSSSPAMPSVVKKKDIAAAAAAARKTRFCSLSFSLSNYSQGKGSALLLNVKWFIVTPWENARGGRGDGRIGVQLSRLQCRSLEGCVFHEGWMTTIVHKVLRALFLQEEESFTWWWQSSHKRTT